MKSAVIVFPGSNCDRDVKVALAASAGTDPLMVWHRETEFPKVDLIVIPGGFSYGDYLRAGSMAANSPAMVETVTRAGAESRCSEFATVSRYCAKAGCCPALSCAMRG